MKNKSSKKTIDSTLLLLKLCFNQSAKPAQEVANSLLKRSRARLNCLKAAFKPWLILLELSEKVVKQPRRALLTSRMSNLQLTNKALLRTTDVLKT